MPRPLVGEKPMSSTERWRRLREQRAAHLAALEAENRQLAAENAGLLLEVKQLRELLWAAMQARGPRKIAS